MDDLRKSVQRGYITVINNSYQPMKVKVDANYPFFENYSVFEIKPGSSEKWGRFGQAVVRINAYNLWHDFKLSPGSVVRLTVDFKLQILDGANSFVWYARKNGPHL